MMQKAASVRVNACLRHTNEQLGEFALLLAESSSLHLRKLQKMVEHFVGC